MSAQNILSPNNLHLYCNTLTLETLEVDNVEFVNVDVDNLTVNNLDVDVAITACPTATIGTLNSTTGTIGNLNCTTLTAATSTSSPLSRTNAIATVSGTGNITFNNSVNAISFPSSGSFVTTPLIFCSYGTVSIPVSGGCTSAPTSVTVYVSRIGQVITLMYPGNNNFVSTGVAGAIRFVLPADMKPNNLSLTTTGPCAYTATFLRYIGMYEITNTGEIWFFGLNQPGTISTQFNKVNFNAPSSDTPVFTSGTVFTIDGLTISYIRQP